jgi:hypothetical protein
LPGWLGPPAYFIVYSVISNQSQFPEDLQHYQNSLDRIADILRLTSPPWMYSAKEEGRMYRWVFDFHRWSGSAPRQIADLGPSRFFGIFALLAPLLEAASGNETQSAGRMDLEPGLNRSDSLELLKTLYLVRLGKIPFEKVKREIERIGFSPDQNHLVSGWVQGEINFVQKSYRKKVKGTERTTEAEDHK